MVLSTAHPKYFLGENVLIQYCLENVSGAPIAIEFGADSRGSSRSQRFKFEVTDVTAARVADPDPAGYHEGGAMQRATLAPQDRWCQSLPLSRYARIDRPGTYTVHIAHDLGWPKGLAPQGETTVALVMPTPSEAERVMSTMLTLPTLASLGFDQSRGPFQDFSVLRYEVYLPLLVRVVRAGNAAALAGIGAIPSPQATRVLIDLLDDPTPSIARGAAGMLAMRLPDPALDGALRPRSAFPIDFQSGRRYLRDAAWRDDFGPDVRAAARRLLTAPDVQDVIEGAFFLEAVGQPADGATLSKALSAGLAKTTHLAFEPDRYPRPRGAMWELMRAADMLVARGYGPPTPSEPGDLALWLVAFGRGARPDGWPDQLAVILEGDVLYLRELALQRLPANSPDRLLNAVGPALASTDIDLQIAACDAVRRLRLDQYHSAVSALLRRQSTTDTFLLGAGTAALESLAAARVEVMQIMASRLLDPDTRAFALQHLIYGAFSDVVGSGGRFAAPEELPKVSAAWREFIERHRLDFEAGTRISSDDPSATSDLAPRGWKFSRRGKPDWPAGR